MDRIKILCLALLVGGLAFGRPAGAVGPSIHLVGPAGVVRAGDTFSLEVRMNSAGQVVNTADLHLIFSPTYLQVLRVDRQQNVWPLWPELPTWNNQQGSISLIPGRPHGVVAIDAPVATIIFRSLASGFTQIVFDQVKSGVYLNDNQGTRLGATGTPLDLPLADALVSTIALDPMTTPSPDVWTATDSIHIRFFAQPNTDYSYRLSSKIDDQPDETPERDNGRVDYPDLEDGVYFFSLASRQGDGVWSRITQYRFLLDRHPPEPFQLIAPPASQTAGQATLSWSPVDATSGVAQSRLLINGRDRGVVVSPLSVNPSWSGKTLTIVVRDGAGNEQRASWHVPGLRQQWMGMMAGLVVIMVAGGWWWWWRRGARSR